MVTPPLDFAEIKQRQQATWATGDFAIIGSRLALIGELLCEAVDLTAGSRVLDIACGAGTVTLAAARRFADVVGIDYVPDLLARGRECAAAERLEATFAEGDAEALAFPDASFDVVLSTFGVMFAPDQARAAADLLRVCRPGGTIGLANWTPEGFWGQVFALNGRSVPPPAGLLPPPRWGTEAGIHALVGDGIVDPRFIRRHFVMRFRSPAHWLEVFRTYFGPIARVFASLDEARATTYRAELLAIIDRFNQRTDGTAVIPAEYLEVVATRR